MGMTLLQTVCTAVVVAGVLLVGSPVYAGTPALTDTVLRNPAQAAAAEATGPFAAADRLAMSGAVSGIETAIGMYSELAMSQPITEVNWRLSRAWFNMYDELPRPKENVRRKRAARQAEKVARKLLAVDPQHDLGRYWLAMALLARADVEGAMTFLGNVREILRIIRAAQKTIPDVDDGGPDRLLAIFLHELPWPWGNDKKSYTHIVEALQIAPYRCANQDLAARLFIEREEWAKADAAIRKLEGNSCTASSPMWDNIYRQHGDELRQQWREKKGKD